MLSFIIAVFVLVGIDQITKYLAIEHLMNTRGIPIIKDVFELVYVENRGAAFGIMQNRVMFFVIITFAILGFIIYYYNKIPKEKKYNYIRFCLILIVSGAIGNLIDRIFLGYVVDFIYFKLIDFPVFNIADIYVTVGAILTFILIIFVYKNDEFFNKYL
ncbi:signal peptidase II [Natranaerovirga pectinivora]|uniref:Lipoprotein signal peptidase n=1 Tax=Natranaerovirga pectinivora TaxID=682400 RepID=A0A4R3MKN1_9FIRM|nr:signal peptidase II [Natranaerovirga pectinivora]TCT14949.1 signal peptidase II [Natranaerovirga pectinivora]